MKCINCGQLNEENAKYCEKCGKVLLINIKDNEQTNTTEHTQIYDEIVKESDSNLQSSNINVKTTNNNGKLPGSVSIAGGAISIFGSINMVSIESISGNSIAESFYRSFGVFGIGFGVFMIGIGIYLYNKNN